ncbi:MAG TPA: HAMP domain-containing sensor histidine kinase [Solirubrobacteraceae bacterium]|jgi:two-component system OmpR family sensor kinase|nr:HAMP domain-containing sensor histidine kinase [Solirubrobacteraceae bacterium]
MASLRTRVLASVLLLAATGLVLLAAVTYAEQRSFLQERVDHEAQGAVIALSQILHSLGYLPAGSKSSTAPGRQPASTPSAPGARRSGRGAPGAGPPSVYLPPGTYGQRREASGKVLGQKAVRYSESEAELPAPKLPVDVPLGRLFTVDSAGSSGLRYRVFARQDPEDTGITVAAVPLREVDQTLSRLLLVEGLVIGGVLLALGLSAYFVVRLGLRPLDRIELTAGQIAGGQLSRRVSPADSRTEVGRLGLALNAMLDRLEKAFADRTLSEERLRQFLADASHELRTPLASIRGYAELHRMGATEDAAGTEMAMRRIEDESKRMGVLVEDLLTLARLDEEPAVRRQQVDLAALARDAVEDARATAPDRSISVSSPASAIVSGDPHQLRQVLANLTRNALVHTPAATPIEVSVSEDEGAVTVSVRDHGPGLPADSSDIIFDRFWRAEGGRERGKAGAGLGLAIVHGVLDAHGGLITAQNAAGGGALFVVRLPKFAPESSQPENS